MQTVYGGNTTAFDNGADGLRRQKTTATSTTDYVLDGQSAVREEITKPGSSETVTYLTSPRGPEYRRSSDGTLRWYVYDGLGSVVGEVDGNGDLKSAGFADAYGFARASWKATGETVSRHQFVGGLGHVSEDETGLVYMRARYMDPALGRFISEDPAGYGNNWFVYAGNDPVNAVDPDGRVVVLAGALVAVVGAITFGFGMAWGVNAGWNFAVKYYNLSLEEKGSAMGDNFITGAGSTAGALCTGAHPKLYPRTGFPKAMLKWGGLASAGFTIGFAIGMYAAIIEAWSEIGGEELYKRAVRQ